MPTDKISIIVPVYNGAEDLKRSVPALLAQTYDNIEIILINDGSTDNTAAVCAGYERDNPGKVIFIDAPHGGVSCARNHGLDRADGEWIYFCDADDRPEPEICEYLLQLVKKHNALMSGCALICDNSIHTDIRTNFACRGEEIWDREQILKAAILPFLGIENVRVTGYLYIAFFNRGIIRKYGLRFAPGMVFMEDILFMQEYLQHTGRMAMSDRVLYHYLYRTDSACSTFFRKKKLPFYLAEVSWSRLADLRLNMFRALDLRKEFPSEEPELFVNAAYHRMQLILHDPQLTRAERYRRLAEYRRKTKDDPAFAGAGAGKLNRNSRIFLTALKIGTLAAVLFCLSVSMKKKIAC